MKRSSKTAIVTGGSGGIGGGVDVVVANAGVGDGGHWVTGQHLRADGGASN